ncbi:hypothetical protein DEU56DRAFT_980805 [Suillus clintonianus]|uniref:uncharacterized protein n=1 Tax=Suillus clintonianus TaxID=1904413 RepID=UPI001B85CC15|nr:uncharacterized protein DEU56DRAFT_980805 [Suillus clintonianus]KAG2136633.1 hypothetical protein DEU56DRAFT_980805 [Suillus clintonianus]
MSSTGIPPDTGALMSAVLEGILYGFSVLMFIGTIWALTYKRQMQDINRPTAVVAILLFLVSTMHMVMTIIRLQKGFVKYRDTWPGGPAAFFSDVTEQTYLIQHTLYVSQTVIADGVMVYRCYIVWQSVRVIIFPMMMWCTIVVTGVHAIYNNSQAVGNVLDVFAPEFKKYILVFITSTLSTNLVCSGLLVYRIWMADRVSSKMRTTKSTMMPIVRVLVDAAVLHSVVLFSLLICFLIGNNGEAVLTDMVMPIISIAFYMVLIRIAINRENNSIFPTVPKGITNGMGHGTSQKFPVKPLQVHISQVTYEDRTSASIVGNEDKPSTCEGASDSV